MNINNKGIIYLKLQIQLLIEFSASSTDISDSSVNLADDVEQVGSGDNDIDLYSPKTQGKCLALTTGFYCITFFCRVFMFVSSVICLFERRFEPASS